jgi:hypothetical protein
VQCKTAASTARASAARAAQLLARAIAFVAADRALPTPVALAYAWTAPSLAAAIRDLPTAPPVQSSDEKIKRHDNEKSGNR